MNTSTHTNATDDLGQPVKDTVVGVVSTRMSATGWSPIEEAFGRIEKVRRLNDQLDHAA